MGLSANKSLQINDLNKRYKDFIEGAPEDSFVFGNGNLDSRVVLVGEAPGKDEVAFGKPFVGKAGAILDEFLNSIDLPRNDLYITNAIKYRLSKEGFQKGSLVNRPATADEIRLSAPFLVEEINLISPEFVVTLGNVPLKSILLELDLPIGKIGERHGRPLKLAFRDKDIMLIPLYHPASIIYNTDLKEIYKNDLLLLKEILR